jgi:hypothetical protein
LGKNGVISEKKRVVKLPKKAVVAEAEASKEEATVEKADEEVVSPVAEEVIADKKEDVVTEVIPVEKVEEPKVE